MAFFLWMSCLRYPIRICCCYCGCFRHCWFCRWYCCCRTPVLGLRLGVDFIFPLSQEQELEQQQQQELSPKSKLEFDTKDQVLFLTLLNGYTYSFETSWLFLNMKNKNVERIQIMNFLPQSSSEGGTKKWKFLKLVIEP